MNPRKSEFVLTLIAGITGIIAGITGIAVEVYLLLFLAVKNYLTQLR